MAGVNHRRAWLDRGVAVLLTFSLAGYALPAGIFAATAAAPHAEIRGSVLSSDGLTPVAGVTVKAAHLETSRVYTSSVTSADGRYSLPTLPPGSYDLAVQTGQGLFASDSIVDAVSGRRTVVSLSLRPVVQEGEEPPPDQKPPEQTPPEEKPPEEKPKEEGQKEEKPPEPQEAKKKKKGPGFWRSPTGAVIAIVVGAGLLGAAASSASDGDDGDDEDMSPGSN